MALGSMFLIEGNTILSQMDGECCRVVPRLALASDVVVRATDIGMTCVGIPKDFFLARRPVGVNVVINCNIVRSLAMGGLGNLLPLQTEPLPDIPKS